MTLKEWKGKTKEEATKALSALKEEQFHLRLKKATGEIEKMHRLKEVRREIARGLTYLGVHGDGN